MADGGGDFTVVSDSLTDLEFEVVVDVDVLVLFEVEFEVLSVTIVCAWAAVIVAKIAMPAQNFFVVIIV
jgi:hypothetical protein